MALAYRSGASAIAGANPTGTEPAGAALNDILVAFITTNNATSAPTTSPSGWTDLYNGEINPAFPNDFLGWRVSYIRRGGSAPSLAWTTAATYTEVYIAAFSGVDTTTAIDSQSSAGGTGNTAGHNSDPPSTTAVSAAAMAVCGGTMWQGSVTTYTAPTGYSVAVTNGAGENTALAYKLLSASGAENPGAFGGVSSGGADHTYWDGFTITLNPLVAAPPFFIDRVPGSQRPFPFGPGSIPNPGGRF
jgi:hypothetical protein